MEVVIGFIQRAILQGTPLLYGSTGEILTEKSGNLNLGIPGIMYIGAISGVVGGFFYQTSGAKIVPFWAVLIPLLCCLAGSLLASLLYCFLTVTLKANQNVTGLALTTFGVGLGNFFGGAVSGSGEDRQGIQGHTSLRKESGTGGGSAVLLWLHGVSGGDSRGGGEYRP